MRLFEAYVAVDWSAAKSRGRGTASIWIAFLGRDQPPTVENPPTRASATERVREILVERAAAGDRVLVGFDFAYCFPCGFADAVAPGEGPAWRRVWDLLFRPRRRPRRQRKQPSRCRGDAERARRPHRLLGLRRQPFAADEAAVADAAGIPRRRA